MAQAGRKAPALAGAIGNVLEWYDFALYGFFAVTLGRLFFPAGSALDSQIAAFGVFAAGYFMRPLGGILLGHIGDRFGRKPVLVLSTGLMALATCTIGLLPTAAEIGAWAAGLLVACRLLQGLSIGGEYNGSVVFLVEHAQEGRRGLFGSLSIVGAGVGALLGSASAAAALGLLPEDWGWRVPFIAGLGLGLVGLYLRLRLPAPKPPPKAAGWPLAEVLRDHGRTVLRIFGLTIMHAVGVFMLFIFMKTYLHLEVGVPQAQAALLGTLGLLALMAVTAVAGALSDRFGRKPLLVASAAALVVLAFPLLWAVNHLGLAGILLGQAAFAVIVGTYAGTAPATMSELLPPGVRVTGTALGYNICMAIFGGTTPMVTLWLIREGGSPLSPAAYLMLASVLSLVALRGMPETAKRPLG
ncbi:MAG: MFS transporter [Pseudomonadota bacterium]